MINVYVVMSLIKQKNQQWMDLLYEGFYDQTNKKVLNSVEEEIKSDNFIGG